MLSDGTLKSVTTFDDASPVSASVCLNDLETPYITDPASEMYQQLQADALVACEEQAIALNLSDATCSENLSEPEHTGQCTMPVDECDDPPGTDGTGETGTGGGTGSPDSPDAFE
jgi:hypothetical protein